MLYKKNAKTKNIIKAVVFSSIIIVMIIVLCLKCGFAKINEVTFEYLGEKQIVEVKNGKVVQPLTDPIKEGYSFAGWYLENDSSIETDDILYDFNSKVTENIVLIAKWNKLEEIKTYTVIFDSDGGTVINPQFVEKDKTVYNPCVPFKVGYSFLGWYLNDSLYAFTTPVVNNITLTARWKKEESDPNNGGSSVLQPSVTEPVDTTIPYPFTPQTETTIDSITITAATTDDKTSPNKLVYQYSIDGINYQLSNVFTGLSHNTQYEVYVKVIDEAGNERIEQIMAKTELINAPKDAVITPNNLTNLDVSVSIIKDAQYSMEYSMDGITWINYVTDVIVSANGKVFFRNTDGINYSSVYFIEVDNIDKVSPDDFVPTEDHTTNSVVITASTTDDVSTVLTYEYKLDSGVYQLSNVFNNLMQGTSYTVTVKATDEAGNVKEEIVVFTTDSVFDALASDLIISPTNLTNGNVTVTFEDKYKLLKEYSFDGVIWLDYTEAIEIEENKDVYFRYTDSNGQTGTSYKVIITNIDKVEPNDFTPLEVHTSKAITITAVTTDNVSASLNYEYKLNDETYQVSNAFDNLMQNTEYAVTVKVSDDAGNIREKIMYVTTNEIPTPIILLDKTTLTNTNVVATINDSDGYILECRENESDTYQLCTSPVIIEENTTIDFRLSDGFNYSPTVEKVINYIDKVVPNDFDFNAVSTYNSIAIEEPTTTDDISTSIVYLYSINGISYQESNVFINLTASTNYDVHVKAIDEAGNEKDIHKNISTMVAPDVGDIIADITILTDTDVVLTVSPIISGFTLQYSLDGENYSEYEDTGVVVEQNVNVSFRYASAATQYGNVKSYEVTNIDKLAPAITFTPNGSSTYAKEHHTTLSVVDDYNVSSCMYAISSSNVVEPAYLYSCADGDLISSSAESGNAYLWVKAVDEVGNVRVAISHPFAYDNVKPEVHVTDTSEDTNRISISVNSFDADSGIKGYYYSKDDGVTWTAMQTSGIYIFAGLQNSTTYKIRVKVEDNVGNITISNTLSITTAALGDITMSVNSDTWGQSKTLTVDNERVTGVTYSYSIDDGESWIVIDTAQMRRVFTENTVVRFKATDGENVEETSFSIDHIDTFEPLVNSVLSDQLLLTDTTVGVVVDAEDFGDDSVNSEIKGYQYSKDNGNTWSSIITDNTYLFENLDPHTTYAIKVKVIDNALNETVSSFDVTTTNSCFQFASGTGTISGYDVSKCGTDVVIPRRIAGVTVTAIADSAFNSKGITSVVFPDTIQTIGNSAFKNNLISGSLVIPDSVTSIGQDAFRNDSTTDPVIDSLTIGTGIVNIGRTSFHDKKITSIIIKGSPTIGYGAFKQSYVENLDLGTSTFLDYGAFMTNNLQGELVIPATVTSIGQDAFRVSGTGNLNSLVIKDGVGMIGRTAFHGLTINELVIEGNPVIGYASFALCELTKIDLGSITSLTAGKEFETSKLPYVTLPSSLTAIAASAFGANKVSATLHHVGSEYVLYLDDLSTEMDLSRITLVSNLGVLNTNERTITYTSIPTSAYYNYDMSNGIITTNKTLRVNLIYTVVEE